VAVDRATGDVYVVLNNNGVWRSSDKGKTFERIDGGKISGRCETGWAINMDPNNGKRFACYMLDGLCGCTLDGGKTWIPFTKVERNWDLGAVDWSVPEPKVFFGIQHECGGRMHLSKDAGKTWKFIGTGTESRGGSAIGCGVVEAGVILLHRTDKGGIERSTDDGVTWTKVSELNPRSRTAVVFKDKVYWVGSPGLLVSQDKGKTWSAQGAAVDAIMGPFFGADEQEIMVAGTKSFFLTRDGGKTWKEALPMSTLTDHLNASGSKVRCGLTWFDHLAWDPIGNVLYYAREDFGRGLPAWKCELPGEEKKPRP
jgi:photosystem II stability/assembly factor-like uncharacterized protein